MFGIGPSAVFAKASSISMASFPATLPPPPFTMWVPQGSPFFSPLFSPVLLLAHLLLSTVSIRKKPPTLPPPPSFFCFAFCKSTAGFPNGFFLSSAFNLSLSNARFLSPRQVHPRPLLRYFHPFLAAKNLLGSPPSLLGIFFSARNKKENDLTHAPSGR